MLAGLIGGWEIVLIFAVVLILFGPINRDAGDARRSIGGIFGKRLVCWT